MEKQGDEKKFDITSIEDMVARQSRKQRTEAAILGSIACVGLLACSLLAPNAAGVLSKMVPDIRPTSQKQSVRRAIGRLIQYGYIAKRSSRYELTQEGQVRLQELLFTTHMTHERPARWDKKWRIVIFDIREERKHVRDQLRRMLMEAGFVQLQKSVWVYPHRCDEVIALLKFHLTLGWDLVYIIADAIEGDEDLRRHFNLPRAT